MAVLADFKTEDRALPVSTSYVRIIAIPRSSRITLVRTCACQSKPTAVEQRWCGCNQQGCILWLDSESSCNMIYRECSTNWRIRHKNDKSDLSVYQRAELLAKQNLRLRQTVYFETTNSLLKWAGWLLTARRYCKLTKSQCGPGTTERWFIRLRRCDTPAAYPSKMSSVYLRKY